MHIALKIFLWFMGIMVAAAGSYAGLIFYIFSN